jgi:hypothetical protein
VQSQVASPSSRDVIARRRWVVHLLLLAGFLAALLSAAFLSDRYLGYAGVTDHSIVGGLVLCLVIVHLVQRRQTVGRLARRLIRVTATVPLQTRIAVSDLILLLLTLNAMASGLADYLAGSTTLLPFSGPSRLLKWHADAVIVLVVYVTVHVIRRRRRLRSSHIR